MKKQDASTNGHHDHCLSPGCERLSYSRGLCNTCYNSARAMIARGKTTWDELVSMGLARASKGPGGRLSSIRAEFHRRKADVKKARKP